MLVPEQKDWSAERQLDADSDDDDDDEKANTKDMLTCETELDLRIIINPSECLFITM